MVAFLIYLTIGMAALYIAIQIRWFLLAVFLTLLVLGIGRIILISI